MNAQDAIVKLNSVGGNAKNLSAVEFYDVFRALQGSFTYADEFNQMVTAAADPVYKTTLAAPDVQDKILKDVKVNDANLENFLENFGKDYQIAAVFEVHRAARNKFASRAYAFLQDYNTVNLFNPEDLDELEKVSKILKEDMDKGVITASAKDKKFVDTFIAKVEKEEKAFVLANHLENVDTIPADVIEDNLTNLNRIEDELVTDTGIYAEEDKKISKMFEALEAEPAGEGDQLDPLSSRDFRIKAYDLAAESAKARCASDPAFNGLSEYEKKMFYLKAKEEAAEDFIRETLIAQAAFAAGKPYSGGGTVTAKDKKEFEKIADASISDLKKSIKKGDNNIAPIKINKNVALFALGTAEKKGMAVAKYIAKKTKSIKFFERAKARLEKFKEDHPKTAGFMEKYGPAAGKGALVLGANMLFSPAGGALSAYFAITSARKSYKDLKAKYAADKAYEGKKFKEYLKDHKTEAFVTVMTGVAGAVAAGFGVAGIASAAGAFNYDAAVRRVVRGTASLGVGLASGVNQLTKAKDKKEKRRAWKQMGLAAGIAAVSVFFADDIAKQTPEFLKGIKDKLGFGSDTETKGAAETVAETPAAGRTAGQTGTSNGGYKWGQWGRLPEQQETSEYNGSYRPGYVPTESTELSETSGAGIAKAATEASMKAGITFDNEIAPRALSFSTMDSIWKGGQLKDFYAAIESGQVESVPEGMSKEVYMHKLTQLIKLGPVVHRESIELALRDLKCGGTVLTTEEIMKVHASLATIDKYGEYHGYEPTARTNNIVTSLEANVECETKNVDVRQEYTGGRTVSRAAVVSGNPVVEQQQGSTTINNNTFIFNYNEEANEIVVEKAADPVVPVQEPVKIVEEEVPARNPVPVQEPEARTPHQFNEIIEGNQNLAQVATEKGWIFRDGKFENVGQEKAFAYMNEIAIKQQVYAADVLRTGWGLELNDASFTTDTKLGAAYAEALKKGDVFVANQNGQLHTYMIKGGTFHTALYESDSNKWGTSYENAQREIQDYEARKAGYQNSDGTTTTIINTGDVNAGEGRGNNGGSTVILDTGRSR